MSAGRQRRYRQRLRDGGLVEVTVAVPAARVDELRAFAAELRGGLPPAAARQGSPDGAQGGLFADALPDEARSS